MLSEGVEGWIGPAPANTPRQDGHCRPVDPPAPRHDHLLQREAVVAVQLPAHLRDKMANPRVVSDGRQRLLEELQEEEPSAPGVPTNLLLAKRGASAGSGESRAINKARGACVRPTRTLSAPSTPRITTGGCPALRKAGCPPRSGSCQHTAIPPTPETCLFPQGQVFPKINCTQVTRPSSEEQDEPCPVLIASPCPILRFSS